MPLKINVSFNEKDKAKNKGAFWDPGEKTWFIPDHKDINDFFQWIDAGNISVIIKSPFYLGVNSKECWKCKENTTVISLYSDNFYTLDYEDDEAEHETFKKVDGGSFFSEITYLDGDISNFLLANYPFFKIGYSKTVNGKYWANHCEKCGALQGDSFNHDEPGGAFFPVSEEDCKKLTLIKLPFKYDIGIKGAFSFMSNEDEIFELANKEIWA